MKRGSVVNRLLDRYVGIPAIYACSLLTKKNVQPTGVSRIGILVSPTLGDTLLSSGAMLDVRRAYPDATIVFFASRGSAVAARLLKGVDQIVTLTLTSPIETIYAIRQCRLDLLIDLTPWQRLTAFYTALSRAKFKAGFRSLNQHRHYAYDVTANHSPNVHEVENFRSLLKVLGIPATSEPSIRLSDEFPEAAAQRWIVFHPWASGPRSILREWPTDRWVELAQRLSGPDSHIYITGGPSDYNKSLDLSSRLGLVGLNSSVYPSANGLESLTSMLRHATLVVSVNTGIMHLAAIAGARTIALNGPTATHRWGPIGPAAASVEPFGTGGYLHFGFEFEGNPTDCMERISVDSVVAVAENLLRRQTSESFGAFTPESASRHPSFGA